MRLTVLVQMTKGACPADPGWTERGLRDLERLKWLLWHGHARHAVEAAEGFAEDAWCLEEDAAGEAKAKPARLRAAAEEFATYLRCNGGQIINYGERHRPASASRPASSRARQPGRLQALQQAPVDALDAAGRAPSPASPDARAQRRAGGRLPATMARVPAAGPSRSRGRERLVCPTSPAGYRQAACPRFVMGSDGRDVPTQRDGHPRLIAARGRMAWQTASGHTTRARAEAAIPRRQRVIGDGPRAHADERQAIEVAVAVHGLDRLSEPGCPNHVRVARNRTGLGLSRPHSGSMHHSRSQGSRVGGPPAGRLARPSRGSPGMTVRAHEPDPPDHARRALARPSVAGTPAHTGDVSWPCETPLAKASGCPPNRGNSSPQPAARYKRAKDGPTTSDA